MKVLIAIPAYRCEKQITRVLSEIDDRLASRVVEIAVIDNGSPDKTVEAALAYKKSGRLKNLKVFRNVDNYSLGGTHKVAFLRAESLGATHVLIIHGDNQAKSDEGNMLIDYAETHPETQTVLGSRFSHGSTIKGYSWERIWGNRVLNFLYTLVTLRRCQDLGSGLNLFALKDLKQENYLRFANALTFNFELLLDLIRRRVRFVYLPISWREEDQVSNARNFKIAKTALTNLFSWRFGRNFSLPPAKPSDYQTKEVTG